MAYLYILGTIVFTVYGQLMIKWRVSIYGSLPEQIGEKILFLLKLLLDPLIVSGLLSAFIASLFWMAALTKFELSYAYPFMSLSFVLVFIFSAWFFNETITLYRITGLFLIVAGIIVTNKS